MKASSIPTGLLGFAALLVGCASEAHSVELSKIAESLASSDASTATRIIQLFAAVSLLSLAPGLLVTVTAFTRFVIAFSFLRSGLGLQSTPSNMVLISLSLMMTFYVMAPTFDAAWENGAKPYAEGRIKEAEATTKIIEPFKVFMQANVREKDLAMFAELRKDRDRSVEDGDLRVLVPAFMISELRRGFEIGFLIVLPFLVIDIVVATLTMAMGMMMLPPTVFSLPFKILFFVLIDGWNLVVNGLLRSFA
jgi:flagellar biosynthesis protein FliP